LTWIDKYGKKIVDDYFSQVYPFSCNRGLYFNDYEGNYNFIKLEDKEPLDNYGYYDAFPFTENCAAVKRSEDSDWGFIDVNNNFIIKPRFKYAKQMSDGYAAVMDENDLFGYVDINGNMVIDFQYDNAYSFVNGKAVVEKDGQQFVIDKNNNIINNASKDYIVRGDDLMCELPKNKKYTLYDDHTMYYDHQFRNYNYALQEPRILIENNKYGLIDDYDNTVITAPVWDYIGEFNEGVACAKMGDKWVHIDIEGFPLIHGINRLNNKHFYNDYYGYYKLENQQFKLLKANIKYGIKIICDERDFDQWFDSEIERNNYILKNVHHFSKIDDPKVYIRS
jgi:hypothetical protein